MSNASTCIEKGGVAMGCAWGRCELRTRVPFIFPRDGTPLHPQHSPLMMHSQPHVGDMGSGVGACERGGWRSCMGTHRALPTPGWIEGRSVDIGAGEARSAQPYSQPFKFLKEKNLQPFTF